MASPFADAGGGRHAALVTNVHVLTGAAPKRALPPKGDTIQFEMRLAGSNPLKVSTMTYPLKMADGTSTWIGSRSHPLADVAIVPLPLEGELFQRPLPCLFPEMIEGRYIQTYPGQLVHVIGYPMGWRDRKNKLPIWKAGHIASEPEEMFDNEPRVLIDITGRVGLSGAPVIAAHHEWQYGVAGQLQFANPGKLLGVYASNARQFADGDLSVEELSLEEANENPNSNPDSRPELGFVWNASLLSEMLGTDLVPHLKREGLPEITPAP